MRVSALRFSERWLGQPNHPMQTAVLKLIADSDWAVRRQVAATIGEMPAQSKEAAAVACSSGTVRIPLRWMQR